MPADRREDDAAPGAGDGAGALEALLRATGDPASGALVVLRSGPTAPDGGPGAAGAGGGADLTGLEEEALDRFEVRSCRLRAARDPGDAPPSLTAVVRAPHRRAAFAAARWALAAARERLGDSGGSSPSSPSGP